jgi:hypothetical protein
VTAFDTGSSRLELAEAPRSPTPAHADLLQIHEILRRLRADEDGFEG